MTSKLFTYDLETCFLTKGAKRFETLILEIGIFGPASFQTLVNPLKQFYNAIQLIQDLKSNKQDPEKTINFWTKLLIGKKILNTSVRRKSMEEKAALISSLLVENKNDLFKTPQDALAEALLIAQDDKSPKECVWVAHNGTSFDEKIIRGNAERLKLDCSHITFYDSLPLLRHHIKELPSYSQPIVYYHLFKAKYMAHHAFDDCKALHKILKHLFQDHILQAFETLPKKKTTVKKKVVKKSSSDLLEMTNIGPKSVEFLEKKNISCKAELTAYTKTHTKEQWLKEMKGLYRYKKLAGTLF